MSHVLKHLPSKLQSPEFKSWYYKKKNKNKKIIVCWKMTELEIIMLSEINHSPKDSITCFLSFVDVK
jgi:hypothetical protein